MGIRVSEKHGVNPSCAKCFYCQKNTADLLLLGKLPGDAEAPREATYHMDPCDECKGYMKRGIILIEVKDEAEMDKVEDERRSWKNQYDHLEDRKKPFPGYFIPNPYREGGWWVVSEDFVKRALTPELAEYLLKTRWCFVPKDASTAIGLRDEKGPICLDDSGESSEEQPEVSGESAS